MHHKNGIIETKTEHCVRIYFRKRGFIFMKYINELREGNRISGIYLCKHKQSAVTKNGKQYENVILQDKTGTIDAKIWDPNSMGIREFEAPRVGTTTITAALAWSLKMQEKRKRANIIRRTICRRAVTTSIRCIRSCSPGSER